MRINVKPFAPIILKTHTESACAHVSFISPILMHFDASCYQWVAICPSTDRSQCLAKKKNKKQKKKCVTAVDITCDGALSEYDTRGPQGSTCQY